MNFTQLKTIVIIGATGHFGGRIGRRLLGEPNTKLIVTSRNSSSAQAFASELNKINPSHEVQATSIDQFSDSFEHDLEKLSPDIVIHTAGPYQGQSYRVAEACIAAGSHYIDLADGREFVEKFHQLNDKARKSGVLLVSGASTLPGLSSAVVDHYRKDFQDLSRVEISIAPAHQTPRGLSTIASVLSYCGKSFSVLENGKQTTRYGWQNLKRQQYPDFGSRLSAVCDVPDLTLLPKYFPGVKTVTFHAALEAQWEQLALWCMGWLSRLGIVKNWNSCLPMFNYISEKLIRLGSDTGGMHVYMSGTDKVGQIKEITWHLTAKKNHGPEIPCTPALILARKLAQGKISLRGAKPCLGLISLTDFDKEVESLAISWRADT